MLDIKSIRENADTFDAEFARRNIEPIAAKLIEIDKRRRDFQCVILYRLPGRAGAESRTEGATGRRLEGKRTDR